METIVMVANSNHKKYAQTICDMMEEAARVRGTGIAKRQPEYLERKMDEGKAVIALCGDQVAGFCYIENWEGAKYVANSGLIINPEFRNLGLARKIKTAIFELSTRKFPGSKLFGITTSLAVMKINSELGYKPVTFSELTQDENFWKGCQSCPNFDILQRTERKMCLCTGMICDPQKITPRKDEVNSVKAWETFMKFMGERKIRIQEKTKQFPNLFKINTKETENEKQ